MLGSLLVYGIGWLDFEVGLAQAGVTLATVLLTQYFATRIWQLPVYDPRSALISGLSLCLLLRTNTPALAVASRRFRRAALRDGALSTAFVVAGVAAARRPVR